MTSLHDGPGTAGGDLRTDAVRVLTAYVPAPRERTAQEKLRQDYLGHLAARPDGMWKSCAEGHVTASALVVDPEQRRVLLTLHRKLRMWLQTGGHCEPGDPALCAAALREATEESGVRDLTLLPGGPVRLDRHLTPCAWHLDVQYAALAPPDAVTTISEESLELRWFGYEEVAEVSDASVTALLEAVRGRLGENG